ncbi:hypothetical protein [Acidovorax sp. K2F]|uniref:hypothetical protein n=1 Tax=Acidovorax sp. K2F TaxID=2978125 RepID=UPI0021B13C7A|nr:hypothetical protein [Acidovorax sp. K2F]MCT6720027.1 hypothetical protein [Acidovorax sp. K2F]
MSTLLIAHEVACLLLFFTVFCRMQKTNRRTRAAIRLSFWALGTVAALGMAWPLMGWPLPWFGVLLSLAIVQVQWVTSHYWSGGVPGGFNKGALHDAVS